MVAEAPTVLGKTSIGSGLNTELFCFILACQKTTMATLAVHWYRPSEGGSQDKKWWVNIRTYGLLGKKQLTEALIPVFRCMMTTQMPLQKLGLNVRSPSDHGTTIVIVGFRDPLDPTKTGLMKQSVEIQPCESRLRKLVSRQTIQNT